MSEKKFEECTLKDATHVEIGGIVHEFGDGIVERFKNGEFPTLRFRLELPLYKLINESSFPLLGIKCLREVKPTPIQFEATFVHDGRNWRPLYTVDDMIAYEIFKKKKFKCVEILEDEE
jgi:hypothetical protein